MATEIERKFLVIDESWRAQARGNIAVRQGFLPGLTSASVRIRITGETAFLTVKSATLGITRAEFEYEIPLADASAMLESLCQRPFVEKTRHFVPCGGHMWEIDEFANENAGLVVAEIELQSAEESFALPSWAGREVSGDSRYYNVNLVNHPYKTW